MKDEIIRVSLPKEIIKSAEKIGMSKQDIEEIMRTFVTLEVIANLSRLDKKEAEIISERIKASAWTKTQQKLKI